MIYRQIKTRKFLLKAPLKKRYKTSIWFFRLIFKIFFCQSWPLFTYEFKTKNFYLVEPLVYNDSANINSKKYNKNFLSQFFFSKTQNMNIYPYFLELCILKKVNNKSLLHWFPRNWLYKPLCPSRNKVSID